MTVILQIVYDKKGSITFWVSLSWVANNEEFVWKRKTTWFELVNPQIVSHWITKWFNIGSVYNMPLLQPGNTVIHWTQWKKNMCWANSGWETKTHITYCLFLWKLWWRMWTKLLLLCWKEMSRLNKCQANL